MYVQHMILFAKKKKKSFMATRMSQAYLQYVCNRSADSVQSFDNCERILSHKIGTVLNNYSLKKKK